MVILYDSIAELTCRLCGEPGAAHLTAETDGAAEDGTQSAEDGTHPASSAAPAIIYHHWRACTPELRASFPDVFSRYADAAGRCLLCGEKFAGHFEWAPPFVTLFGGNCGTGTPQDVSTDSAAPARETGQVVLLLPVAVVLCDGRRVG